MFRVLGGSGGRTPYVTMLASAEEERRTYSTYTWGPILEKCAATNPQTASLACDDLDRMYVWRIYPKGDPGEVNISFS